MPKEGFRQIAAASFIGVTGGFNRAPIHTLPSPLLRLTPKDSSPVISASFKHQAMELPYDVVSEKPSRRSLTRIDIPINTTPIPTPTCSNYLYCNNSNNTPTTSVTEAPPTSTTNSSNSRSLEGFLQTLIEWGAIAATGFGLGVAIHRATRKDD